MFGLQRVRCWVNMEIVAFKKLCLLHAAHVLHDLRIPPGNRLEALKGDRQGQHGICINDHWRICFVWTPKGLKDMELSITTDPTTECSMTSQLTLPTPGEILATEFLQPLGITRYRLAQSIRVPQTRIAAIIKSGRAITADTVLRLTRFFGTSVEFWLNLQSQYNTDTARMALGAELDAIEPLAVMA